MQYIPSKISGVKIYKNCVLIQCINIAWWSPKIRTHRAPLLWQLTI